MNPADDELNNRESETEIKLRNENYEKQIALLSNVRQKTEGRKTIFTQSIEVDRNYKPPIYDKTRLQKAFLQNAIKDNFIFIDLTDDERDMFINAMQPQHFEANDMIIQMGDLGDYFYIVSQGTVNFVDTNAPDKPVVGNCGRGGSFGELALLYDAPRAISCIAATPVDVFQVDQKTFRLMLARHQEDQHQDIRELIRGISIFRNLDETSLNRFTRAMAHVHWKVGDRIVQKGSEGNVFYIIQEGEVKIHDIGLGDSKFEDQILRPGDWFGERALLTGEPRAANVTALTAVTTLAMDRETFESTIGPLKGLMEVEMRKQFLRGVPLFAKSNVTDPELDQIVNLMREVVYEKDQMLSKSGEPYEMNLWIIRHGRLTVAGQKTGSEIHLHSGDYFGDKSIRGEGVHIASHDATVEEELTTWVLSRADIEHVIGDIDRLGETAENTKEEDKILLQDLQKMKILGQGAFGKVWLVGHTHSNDSYALKAITKWKLLESRQEESVIREKELLCLLDHPFILRLIATYQDEENLYLLVPLVPGGELFSVLHKQKTKGKGLPNDSGAFYTACVVEALGHFHQRAIAYRDLKLENILIDANGYCKVVDLGFAKIVTDKTYTLVGTPEYLAPEIIMSKGHDKAVDYWSLGVLAYELLVGVSPFYRANSSQIDMFKRIVLAKYIVPSYVDEVAKSLISSLLQRNQMKRLGNLSKGYLDIKSHDWFEKSGIDFKRLLKLTLPAPWVPQVKSGFDASNFDDFSALERERERGRRLTQEEQDKFVNF